MTIMIKTSTKMYGVFGDPVSHSRSPLMLNRAFAASGIDAAYAAFHVKPEQLEQAVQGIRALQFGGVNITIPHKVEVMKYLDEIDEGARIIGAVNTLVNDDGKWIGYNTDGIGYVRSLKEETGFSIQGKNLLVLGAGGAARGIVYALSQEQPARIWIANRSVDKAVKLAADMSKFAETEGISLDRVHALPAVDFIVNTTNVGMHPYTDESPLDASVFHEEMVVSDIVYTPRKTKFLAEAEARGCQIHEGLGMFVYQGAYAFEYWTGRPAPIEEMRAAVDM